MSYILDALRKSEEARRRQQGPDLSLAESTRPLERARASRALPLLALALLVNGAVLGAWLLQEGAEDAAQPVTASTPERETGRAQPLPPHPAADAPLATAKPTTNVLPDGSMADWRQRPVRRLVDLNSRSRDRFPNLAISTHIYAEEARFREVGINGRRYQEGDRIGGLPLLEITERGVLIGFEEQVVRIDLQEEWGL